MAHTRILILLALASSCGWAQTPFFNDGSAFGGSRVFSEGLNPLGNAARFDRAPAGTYLGWTQGDNGAKETFAALKIDAEPTLLGGLSDNSWATRTRSYSIGYADKGLHTSFIHEETTAAIANPNPGTSGSVELRRNVVDRTCVGAGSHDQNAAYGILMRVERWRTGVTPNAPLQDYLAYRDTQATTTLITFDLGYILEITQGIRLGVTVDRLLPRHFGDVYEGPQARAGFQVDIGSLAQLSVESDVNKAMRMPFPLRQRVSSASLRIAANPTLTLAFGAERRSLGGQALLQGGVSLFLNAPSWRLGAGFQFSQQRPMMGVAISGF